MTYDADYQKEEVLLRPRLPGSVPRLTYVLIAVNILAFLASFGGQGPLALWGSLVPGLVLVFGEWWRLITAGFLHAGIMHIAFNLYALYSVGPQVEKLFGMWRFLWIYMVALLWGSGLVALLSPLNSNTVGASGAILGVMGALLVYLWQHKDLVGSQSSFMQLAWVIFVNLLIGITPGISLWGHLGGFMGGAAAAWAVLPRYKVSYSPWTRLEVDPLDTFNWLKIAGVLVGLILILVLSFWVRV